MLPSYRHHHQLIHKSAIVFPRSILDWENLPMRFTAGEALLLCTFLADMMISLDMYREGKRGRDVNYSRRPDNNPMDPDFN